MYCKHCGSLVSEKAEICPKCGCKPLSGDSFCQFCGTKVNKGQQVCAKCGKFVVLFFDRLEITPDFSAPILNGKRLKPYYQKEFQKIYKSNGAYKGKFNICAFLFGSLWALTNPCWLEGVFAIIISVLTAGVGGIVSCFYFGARGNYTYYKNFILLQKKALWDKVNT